MATQRPREMAGALAAPTALLACAALAGASRLRDNDTFWHVVAGRWILAHGAIPTRDPFRFTGSAPWLDHEWLFQVLVARVEASAGFAALALLPIATALLLAALLASQARRAGASRTSALLIALLAVLGARPRLLVRPELATMIGVTVLLALLQEWRRSGRFSRLLWTLPLVAAWVNAHPGALIAPVLALAYLVGAQRSLAVAEPPRAQPPARRRRALVVPPLLAGALLLNPAGWRVALVPATIAAALRGLPGSNPEWLPVWRAPQPALLLALAAALALLVATARRRVLDSATALAFLIVLPLAALSIRHQATFFLVAAFAAIEAVAALERSDAWPPRALRRDYATLAGVIVVAAGIWLVWPPSGGPLRPRQGTFRPGLGIDAARFPGDAVGRLASWPRLGHLYNDVGWGGYLLWRLYPPRQVFIDGRNEVNPELLRRLGRARGDAREWAALLADYAIDGAIVRYDDRPRPVGVAAGGVTELHTSSALLFPRDTFALVYWDDVAMLFVRRTPPRAARLAQEEYRFVQPEDWRAAAAAVASDPALRSGWRAELTRRTGESPPSRRAARLLAMIAAFDDGARAGAR